MMRILFVALLGLALLGATHHAHGTEPARDTAQTATSKTAATKVSSRDLAVDRLQLDATSITGNRELPKVMSIVPWKQAEPPAGPDRPMGSLIDELLAPLERDEFRREITYYRDLTSHSVASPTATAPGAQ